MKRIVAISFACLAGALSGQPVFAQADFYKDKTIDLVIGGGAGGSFDLYGRLFQRHLGAHIRRMCSFYRRARDELTEVLNARLGDYLSVAPPDQGMHLTAHLRPGLSDVAIAEAAAQRGVVVRPLSGFYVAAPPVSALMLGFTGFDLPTLHRAAEALVGVFEDVAGG